MFFFLLFKWSSADRLAPERLERRPCGFIDERDSVCAAHTTFTSAWWTRTPALSFWKPQDCRSRLMGKFKLHHKALVFLHLLISNEKNITTLNWPSFREYCHHNLPFTSPGAASHTLLFSFRFTAFLHFQSSPPAHFPSHLLPSYCPSICHLVVFLLTLILLTFLLPFYSSLYSPPVVVLSIVYLL